jgi:hypothetical protein
MVTLASAERMLTALSRKIEARTMSNVLAIRRPGPRLVLVALAVLVVAVGMTIGGCLYISHVAAGIARVPVMFDVSPSQTPTAPR